MVVNPLAAFFAIAGRVRRPVVGLAVSLDPVISMPSTHASTILVLKSDLGERRRAATEAAQPMLAEPHSPDAALVLPFAGGCPVADFPPAGVREHSLVSLDHGLAGLPVRRSTPIIAMRRARVLR